MINIRTFVDLKGLELTGVSDWHARPVMQYLRYGDARIAAAEGAAATPAAIRVPVYRTAVVDQVYPEREILVARYTDGVCTQSPICPIAAV